METPAELTIPRLCLVLLQGPRGAGKTTFAERLFAPDEVLGPADDLLDRVTDRLERGLLTVVDDDHLREDDFGPLLRLARRHLTKVVVIALEPPPEVVARQGSARIKASRELLRQARQARKTMGEQRVVEGIHVLTQPSALERIHRQPLSCDAHHEAGPFDVVGDVHGCMDELEELVCELGYAPDDDGLLAHPEGRRLVFVGDLCDRGPRVLDVYRLVIPLVEAGRALCVLGNHEDKLLRCLQGRKVKVSRGLQVTLDELDALPADEGQALRARLIDFCARLPVHLVLDDGRLVIAHAGIKASMIGREGSRVRAFALYGDTTGETDAEGYPVRRDWAARYRGEARVVYGHTPVERAVWRQGTANVDLGCCFGGALAAVRYPEGDFVCVPARAVHWSRAGGA